MKILSCDPGIKNLAFCLFEKSSTDENFKITKWDIINLSEQNEIQKCYVIDKKGVCNKPAKYKKDASCFCLKHSKKQPFVIPTPDLKPTYINKQKLQKLFEIADKYNIKYEKPIKKADIVSLINQYTSTTCFEEIKSINASNVNLVEIGKNIKYKFNDLFLSEGLIDYVIIENQISPIANRMKTIQGMISQYFIMREPMTNFIQFVSASNKLKEFTIKDNITDTKSKSSYSDRKKLGISKCLEIITSEQRFNDQINYFKTHKKKDDLSDSFLQGLWFISTSNF